MKIFRLSLAVGISLFVAGSVSAQTFRMSPLTISSGGGLSSSTSFKMTPTVGQALTGLSSSTGHRAAFGFWNQFEALRRYHFFSYHFFNNWNLMSLADTVSDYRKNALFPFATSAAFSFENNGYTIRDTLRNGWGYWLKVPQDTLISLIGTPVTSDTFEVQRGWNLIGSIGTSVLMDSIIEIPPGIVTSHYFGYWETYVVETTIEPGRGYWVKTDTLGKLVLRPSPQTPPALASASQNSELEGMNILSVQRESGGSNSNSSEQKLMFGKADLTQKSLDRYDLPPVPPAGALDARFSTNRFAELIPEKIDGPKEIPLLIQGNGDPLKIGWTLRDKTGLKYTLVEKNGTKILAQHKLLSDGSVTLRPNENSRYVLRVEQIPTQFSLYQNYPNPFNPRTTIRFDLPVAAMVTLKVYNVLGQEVMTPLNNEAMDEGQHSVEFDARNLASGAYFYRFSTNSIDSKSFHSIKKMLLLK